MNEAVTAFFDVCNSDPDLRRRVAEAEECYPGSLEIREALVKAVLLPIAAELGYEFTVEDLRAYETRLKLRIAKKNSEGSAEEDAESGFTGDDSPVHYWLLDYGWSNDEASFCGGH